MHITIGPTTEVQVVMGHYSAYCGYVGTDKDGGRGDGGDEGGGGEGRGERNGGGGGGGRKWQ